MHTLKMNRAIEILLVEDNPGDVRLIQEALREVNLYNCLQVVNDGIKAIAYLKQKEEFSNVKRPDLVLLDLNLSGMDGRKVLNAIKSDNDLKTIPVVILSSSDAEEDIDTTYASYANSYVQKPGNLDQYINIVKSIKDFWFSIAKLPSR